MQKRYEHEQDTDDFVLDRTQGEISISTLKIIGRIS